MMKRLGMFRGVNLGGWLSQCDYSEQRLMNFMTDADFARIASWGLDHIRLPVDCDVVMDQQGTLLERGFERISWAIDRCRENGLKLVLDLHKAPGFGWDATEHRACTELLQGNEAAKEQFLMLWEAFAKRFGDLYEHVVFELLNELTDPAFADEWNRLSGVCIRRIRAFAPQSIILVGGHSYNAAAAVESLDAPADNRVVYNFHCYEPQPFTHQGAYWVDSLDPAARVRFADSGVTETYFEQLFEPALRHARENGTTLYCGEYGVIDVVPCGDALAWLRCVNAVFRRMEIPHCIWNYRQMDFGLDDARWDALRDELNDAL